MLYVSLGCFYLLGLCYLKGVFWNILFNTGFDIGSCVKNVVLNVIYVVGVDFFDLLSWGVYDVYRFIYF